MPQAVRDRRTVQRVLFGETDVLDGESFEDHGIEVVIYSEQCLRLPVCLVLHTIDGSSPHMRMRVVCPSQDGARLNASIKAQRGSPWIMTCTCAITS